MPTTDSQRAWEARNPVHIKVPEDIGRLLDHHADAVRLTRRRLAIEVLRRYTADATADVAQEMEERVRRTRTERKTL